MRLLLAHPDTSERRRLRRHLEGRGHRVDLARDGVEAWHQLRVALPDAVVTDVDMPHMGGRELTRTIRRNPATRDLPVLMLARLGFAVPPGVAAGRDGADEVATLPLPLDCDIVESRVVALLERLSLGRDAIPVSQGRLVAVTSAKGGSGVSAITAALSVALATSTQRSIVTVDLDLEYGDLPMLLDVPHASGVDDLIAALGVGGEAVAPEDHLARHASGLRILGSPRTPVDALRVDEIGVTHLLNRLLALHDLIVVDVPPGFGDPALVTLTRADRIVVVVVPEVTALRRTLTLLGVLRSLGVADERLLFVFNRTVDSDALPRDRVERLLERPVPVDLPHDLALFHRAATAGKPVVELDPGHPASQAIARLARFLDY
ncbi:MAG TPA: response regulator [Candidatus Dormibacteraeota bacterium]|nr:response regulator [Candidatus Dormibacteraeota bacterium]